MDNTQIIDSYPLIEVDATSYPSSLTVSEVMENVGGEELYSADANRLVWVFDSPETIQEYLMAVLTKYLGEDRALSWMSNLDSTAITEKNDYTKVFIEANEKDDAYHDIERKWYNSHDIADKFEMFKASQSDTMLKGSSEDEWLDAFILNLDNRAALGRRWDNERGLELKDEWIDLIDDLMFFFVGVQAYYATRLSGGCRIFGK